MNNNVLLKRELVRLMSEVASARANKDRKKHEKALIELVEFLARTPQAVEIFKKM
jgi:hypothetical protein